MGKKEDWIWVAGLFDGEGCVMIVRREPKGGSKSVNHLLSIQMNMSHKQTMEKVFDIVGCGSFHKHISKLEGRKVQWRWDCTSNNAYNFAKKILPYSVTKKKELELAIIFQEKHFIKLPRQYKLSQKIVEDREKFHIKMKNLKKEGEYV